MNDRSSRIDVFSYAVRVFIAFPLSPVFWGIKNNEQRKTRGIENTPILMTSCREKCIFVVDDSFPELKIRNCYLFKYSQLWNHNSQIERCLKFRHKFILTNTLFWVLHLSFCHLKNSIYRTLKIVGVQNFCAPHTFYRIYVRVYSGIRGSPDIIKEFLHKNYY